MQVVCASSMGKPHGKRGNTPPSSPSHPHAGMLPAVVTTGDCWGESLGVAEWRPGGVPGGAETGTATLDGPPLEFFLIKV